jgi:drug/metabolite transporter superfamily protein YnfA
MIKNPYKLIFMLPMAVAFQIVIIMGLYKVYQWSLNYNLVVALIVSFISMLIMSTLLSYLFIKYSGRDYKISLYASTPLLLVSLYYSIFVHGFSIFSFLIILLPIMYSGGIKYYLENNDGHNRSVALEEHLKLKRQVAEKKIEEAFRKKGLNKEI